ncbi:MAG: MFS transporter [Patescibacteria group bacterium]
MHRNIKLLAVFNFLTDFILFAPVAIIYFAQVSGSYALGMSVFSITFLSSSLFEIPTGIFSDFIGRKKTVILGSIAYLVGFILYAWGGSLGILVLGAIFEGLARSFYSGNNDALLYDTLTETNQIKKYHEYLGKVNSMYQIALAVSALLGGFIAGWSLSLVMWLSVVPKLGMVLVSLLLTEPHIHTHKSGNIYAHLKEAISQFKTNRKLRYLSVARIIKFAFGESAYLFRTAFIQSVWPIWALGIANTLNNICAAFSFYFSGRILNRLTAKTALTIEIIYNRIANLVALLFPTVASPLLMASTSLTFGIGEVANNSLTQKEFTSAQRATMGSLGSLMSHLVFAVVSFCVGLVGDHFGPQTALVVVNILLLAPLWFYRKIFAHEKS